MKRALSVVVVSSLVGSSFAVNLMTNGSFEAPFLGIYELLGGNDSTSITGWTTIPQGVERFSPSDYDAVLGQAHDGRVVVDLAPFTHSVGGLFQDVGTQVGQQYTLTFCGATSIYANRLPSSIIDLNVGNFATQSYTVTNNAVAIAWQGFSYTFTANQSLTRIQFSNAQDGNTHFAFIDSVSLAPVPEPFTLILAAGGLALAARRRLKA